MANIKDIAKLAGVAHGTVSNVLNNKGNVSVKKMEAVLAAAKQMGYQLSVKGQQLRSSNDHKIAVILPQLVSEKYTVLFNAIRQTLLNYPDITYDLFITDGLEFNELKVLERVQAGEYKQVITVTCLDNANIYFDALQVSPDDIIFVYRKPIDAQRFFTLNYDQPIDSIVEYLFDKRLTNIGVIAEENHWVGNQSFATKLEEKIRKQISNAKITMQYSSDNEVYKEAFNFFTDSTALDVIIAQDTERAKCITQASFYGGLNSCPEVVYLSDSASFIANGILDYPVNYAQLGKEVVEQLLSSSIDGKTEIVEIANLNVSVERHSLITFDRNANQTLNLLTLPSPSTNALIKLLPHFYKQTGITLNVSIRPYEEVLDILNNIEQYSYFDLVRIDIASFPWLAEKILTPLNQIGNGIDDLLNYFSDAVKLKFSYVNNLAYATPFDTSIQLLFYRKDIFDSPILKRMFYEKNNKELSVPKTFDEFDLIARFFNEIHRTDDPQRPEGASSSIGGARLIATEFLQRYYANGGRLLSTKSTPQLNDEIAVASLQAYINQLRFNKNFQGMWWDEPVKSFENSELAMLITYMNLFNDVAHSKLSPNIGFASVPGEIPQIGGGVIGLSKQSQKGNIAEQFYRWLYSPDVMDHLVMLGGNSVYQDLKDNQPICYRYPWLSLAYNELSKGIRENVTVAGETIDLRKVEHIIGQGIMNAVYKIMSIDEAIENINKMLRLQFS